MTSPLLTDAEFHALLGTRFNLHPSAIRARLTKWGKLEPRYVATEKGFGRRKGWTHGDLATAKKYLKGLLETGKIILPKMKKA